MSTKPREDRYTWISHVASSGSELAVQAWWRYRYTGDNEWLRTHAYPLLRGTVEFYRHLVKKSEDGRYHLSGTNAHEDFWGVKDGIMDLAVGASWDDDGGAERGAVYVLFLNADGTVKTEQKISSTTGGLTGSHDTAAYVGVSVAGVGALEGDGTTDVTVGAYLDDDGGS
ncbi:MAG: hypothetical protein GY700_07370, partial [Propionibacteriaceae bacterium]|nr:hypothetical protein [Propionibacteriaceae bacterium]